MLSRVLGVCHTPEDTKEIDAGLLAVPSLEGRSSLHTSSVCAVEDENIRGHGLAIVLWWHTHCLEHAPHHPHDSMFCRSTMFVLLWRIWRGEMPLHKIGEVHSEVV